MFLMKQISTPLTPQVYPTAVRFQCGSTRVHVRFYRRTIRTDYLLNTTRFIRWVNSCAGRNVGMIYRAISVSQQLLARKTFFP